MQTQKQNEKPSKRIKQSKKDVFSEELVAMVTTDFEHRRNARLALEKQWELNLNFLSGNQYCDVNARGEITDEDQRYFWQDRKSVV